jgi:predicted MFS family arabinose efflux permease
MDMGLYLLAIPTIFLALGLTRLRDPGRRIRPSDSAEKISLRKAIVQLARIRSFPRLWVAAGFLGAASFGIFGLASLYFEKEFGLGARGRGFVQFLIGAGWFGGVLLGGRFASSATASGRYKRLVVICATSFLAIAVSGVLLSVVPTVFLAYVTTVVLAVGNGVWQSPFFSTVAKVAPPSLSGQAFGSAATAYALGSFLILPVAFIADHSKRGAFLVIALFGALSGLAAWSVTNTVEQDIAAGAAR